MNLYKRSLCFNAIHTVLSSRNVNGMTPEILYNKNFHLPHNFLLIKSVLFLSLARFFANPSQATPAMTKKDWTEVPSMLHMRCLFVYLFPVSLRRGKRTVIWKALSYNFIFPWSCLIVSAFNTTHGLPS